LAIPSTSANYLLTGLELPDPEPRSVFASSFDTEGEIPVDEHSYVDRTRDGAETARSRRNCCNSLAALTGQ
jgi:hypothetical protein